MRKLNLKKKLTQLVAKVKKVVATPPAPKRPAPSVHEEQRWVNEGGH